MAPAPLAPLAEMKAVLGRYAHDFDEPDTIALMAMIREKGVLGEKEWKSVALGWPSPALLGLTLAVADQL